MATYNCTKCSYQTNDKRSFDNHKSRKIPCNLSKPKNKIKLHGNANTNIITPCCKECNKTFASNQSLARHSKTFHSNNNKQNVDNGDITGDNNNITSNNHSNNTTNNNITNTTNSNNTINNITIINLPEIHPYSYYNGEDLTLYEQYLILASKTSPYTAILDFFNLNLNKSQYHNMRIPNIHKPSMDIHTGEEWEKRAIDNVIAALISSHKKIIYRLFNKFRIFLNTKTIELIPMAIYYGCVGNKKVYRKLSQDIKLHLYNRRDKKNVPNLDIPDDDNNEKFCALSKNFTWAEIYDILTNLDQFDFDFDKNLDEIKEQLLKNKIGKDTHDCIFKKFIKRIDNLITSFKVSNYGAQINDSKTKKNVPALSESSDTLSNSNSTDNSTEELSEESDETPKYEYHKKPITKKTSKYFGKESKKEFNETPKHESKKTSKYSEKELSEESDETPKHEHQKKSITKNTYGSKYIDDEPINNNTAVESPKKPTTKKKINSSDKIPVESEIKSPKKPVAKKKIIGSDEKSIESKVKPVTKKTKKF